MEKVERESADRDETVLSGTTATVDEALGSVARPVGREADVDEEAGTLSDRTRDGTRLVSSLQGSNAEGQLSVGAADDGELTSMRP